MKDFTVERRRKVKLLGLERNLHAEVRVLNSFSAHADRLVAGILERIGIVGGDDV